MPKIPFDRVNWTTSIFLISTALIAIIGVPITVLVVGQSEAGRWLGLAEDGEIRDRLGSAAVDSKS